VLRPERRGNLLELLEEERRDVACFGEYAPKILDHQAISIEDIATAVHALIGLYFKARLFNSAG